MNSSSTSDRVCIRIPDDSINEIFLRLPIKSLIRFKAVCKHWKTMTKDPIFIKSHFMLRSPIHHNPPFPSVLIFRVDNYIFSVDLQLESEETRPTHINRKLIPFTHPELRSAALHPYRSFLPLGTCNGIICIYARDTNQFFLWNPMTKECRDVGQPRSTLAEIKRSGFGYVPSLNDYKIVLFVAPVHIWVYSLKANKWHELEASSMKLSLDELRKEQVCSGWRGDLQLVESVQLDDALYWILYGGHGNYLIHKFDLVNEVFDKVANLKQKQANNSGRERILNLGVVGGNCNNLCVSLQVRDYREVSMVETCMLEHHDNGGRGTRTDAHWKRLHKIEGDWKYLGDDHYLMGLACNGKVLIFYQNETYMDHMLIVDTRQEPHSYIEVNNEHCPPYKSGRIISYIMCYVPSLFSPFSL